MSELDPPRHCMLKGEGQGGVAGFARGEAEVLLDAGGRRTALSYTAKATIGGKLAQIGQRLIDGAAKQIADDFFTRFVAAAVAAGSADARRCRPAGTPRAQLPTPATDSVRRPRPRRTRAGDLGRRPDRA